MPKLIITIIEQIKPIPDSDRHVIGYSMTTDIDQEGAEKTTLNRLATLCFAACASAMDNLHGEPAEHLEITERDSTPLEVTLAQVIAKHQSPFPSEL